jgi:hypothetical protein
MTDNKRSKLQLTLADIPIMSMYFSPTVSGFTMGLRSLQRNVKLTYCVNLAGEVDCHIKDDGKVIWQKTCPQEEMMKRLEKAFKKSIYEWKPRQKIIIFNPELLDYFNQLSLDNRKTINVDLEGYLTYAIEMVKEIIRGKTRLKDVVKDKPVFGLQKRWSGMWIVMAEPDGMGFRFPLRSDKGLLGEIFMFQGLEFYFGYLDEQGLLDNLGMELDLIEGGLILDSLDLSLLNINKINDSTNK